MYVVVHGISEGEGIEDRDEWGRER